MAATVLNINGKEVEVDTSIITVKEAIEVEKVFGGTWKEWSDAMDNGSIRAAAVILLIVAHRSDPNIRYEDILQINLPELFKKARAVKKDENGLERREGPNPTKTA